MKRVCVFLGSSIGKNGRYVEAAVNLGRELAQRSITAVYGGTDVGLMAVLADSALNAGGEVVGVIPKKLVDKEIAHKGLTELIVVESMHERKAKMADLADGFVAMPGGLGTLEEIAEIATWAQLGIHHKPCGLLNIDSYYNYLNKFLDHTVKEGFLRKEFREMLMIADSPAALLDKFEGYSAPLIDKWSVG